jgi:hypothetical protein
MGRRRAALVICVLGVLLAACGKQSRVDPEQAVTVSGTVAGPDGQPAPERPVQLGVGVTTGDGAFAALTLGLHCTSGACSGAIRDVVTDGSGAYRIEIQGSDTQSTFGEAESVLVTASGDPSDGEVSGPLTSARFQVQTPDVHLPTLSLVDPGLRIEDAGTVGAAWEPVAPGPYELRFEGEEAMPIWLVTSDEPWAAIDPRFLEDTAGRVVVSGRSQEVIEGSDVALTWRSGGVPYVAAAGPPPSRGRPCRTVAASGAAATSAARCGLTDGDLSRAAVLDPVCRDDAEQQCEPPSSVIVELPEPVAAELVVVRGCSGGCAVDVSADGTTYRPAGAVAEGFGAVSLDGAAISTVRVGLGDAPTELREVSVWAAAPSTGLAAVDDGARSEIAAPYDRRDDGVDPPLVLVVGAAAAILVTASAGAFALGRRRASAARLPSQ